MSNTKNLLQIFPNTCYKLLLDTFVKAFSYIVPFRLWLYWRVHLNFNLKFEMVKSLVS